MGHRGPIVDNMKRIIHYTRAFFRIALILVLRRRSCDFNAEIATRVAASNVGALSDANNRLPGRCNVISTVFEWAASLPTSRKTSLSTTG